MLKVMAMVSGVMHLYEKRSFDGTGFISIKHTHAALVDGHYYSYGEVGYLKGTNVCDLKGLAPENSNVFSEDSGELSPEEFAREIRVIEIRKS